MLSLHHLHIVSGIDNVKMYLAFDRDPFKQYKTTSSFSSENYDLVHTYIDTSNNEATCTTLLDYMSVITEAMDILQTTVHSTERNSTVYRTQYKLFYIANALSSKQATFLISMQAVTKPPSLQQFSLDYNRLKTRSDCNSTRCPLDYHLLSLGSGSNSRRECTDRYSQLCCLP